MRKLYPDHSIVAAYDGNINILGFPGAFAQPLSPADIISTVHFVPLARRLSRIPGVLVDSISFGAFNLAWDVRCGVTSHDHEALTSLSRNMTSCYT